MEIVEGYKALPRRLREPAVAIGNFDGLHLGHKRLLAETLRYAQARQADAVVLTFAPHPARLLNPALAPPLLTTEARKLQLIAQTGIKTCVVVPFDLALANMAPEEFVRRILVDSLAAREICVGTDFTFGYQRAGNVNFLTSIGNKYGFSVMPLAPVSVGGMVCSSTKIREFILEGRVEGAALLLGRAPEVEGQVVAGQGRGGTMGVPTANLQPATEVLPPPGVYAGWAEVLSSGFPLAPGQILPAAINIGFSPTFGSSGLRIEAHILDYPGGTLLGAQLRLGFQRRLRNEQRFLNVESLVTQIRSDLAIIRTICSARTNRPEGDTLRAMEM